MHALHDGVTGKGWARRGISLREPRLCRRSPAPAHRPNVLLIVSESVRADAMCSAPSLGCTARFLDEAAPDRVALGRLTTQSSGTFTSCVMLWTGLAPRRRLRTMHHAPVLWEIARALGYRTAYIGAQNLRYDDFGAFLERAGDRRAGQRHRPRLRLDPHIGAPDENATARAARLREGRGARRTSPTSRFFTSRTRTGPTASIPRSSPSSRTTHRPWGDVEHLHNHYRNSVLMQERTVAGACVSALQAAPGWDDTVVIFLSDHGEQFREHGGLYHLSSLFEEQVRIPGWILAGDRAL